MSEEKENKNSYGIVGIGIPAEVFFNPGLTATENRLFGILQLLAAREEGCTANNFYLARTMMCGEQTISNSVAALKHFLYIEVYAERILHGTKRHIHINPAYKIIYEKLTLEVNDFLKRYPKNRDDILELKKHLIPTIKNIIGGYKNNYSIKNIIRPYKNNYKCIIDNNSNINKSFIYKRLKCNSDESQNNSEESSGDKKENNNHSKKQTSQDKLLDQNPKRKRRQAIPRNYRNIPSIIDNIWNACPTTTTHKPNTKTWKSIIVMFRQLIDGQFTQGKYWDTDWKKRIPEEYFDGKCWPTREVKKVLADLTLYSQQGYWPSDKSNFRHLQTLLYNPSSGKSMFLSAAYKPPKPLCEKIYAPKDKTTANILERLIETLEIGEHDAQRYNRALIQTAKDLKAYYEQDLPTCKQAGYHFPSGETFAESYAEWIANNWPRYKEDKIGTSSRVFEDFVLYMEENLNIC